MRAISQPLYLWKGSTKEKCETIRIYWAQAKLCTQEHYVLWSSYFSRLTYITESVIDSWKVLVTAIDALGHFKQSNCSIVGGDGGHRVGKVRAGTTAPVPDHKGFKATVTVRDPPTQFLSEFSEN